MKARIMVVVVAGLALVASSALAQQGEQRDGQRQRGERPDRPARQRAQRPGGAPMRGLLPADLGLTAEQQTQVREIQQKMATRMREQREQREQQGEQDQQVDREKVRQARQQLMEAARAGDEQRVERLQAHLRQMGFGEQRGPMEEAFYSQVDPILTPTQRQKVQQWRKLRDSGLPMRLLNEPQALKDAALEVETLSAEQKEAIENAFKRYSQQVEGAEERERAELGEKFAMMVAETLKPSQQVLLTAATMRDGARDGMGRGDRMRRGDGPARGDRPGRGDRPDRGQRRPNRGGAGASDGVETPVPQE